MHPALAITLLHLSHPSHPILATGHESWAAVTPDGRYKLGGDTAGAFWFAINLCRFEPGELDPISPGASAASRPKSGSCSVVASSNCRLTVA